MPRIGAQDMTASAQRPKILEAVVRQLPGMNMIDVCFFESEALMATNTSSAIAAPDRDA
jgi:hypothetical protein